MYSQLILQSFYNTLKPNEGKRVVVFSKDLNGKVLISFLT